MKNAVERSKLDLSITLTSSTTRDAFTKRRWQGDVSALPPLLVHSVDFCQTTSRFQK